MIQAALENSFLKPSLQKLFAACSVSSLGLSNSKEKLGLLSACFYLHSLLCPFIWSHPSKSSFSCPSEFSTILGYLEKTKSEFLMVCSELSLARRIREVNWAFGWKGEWVALGEGWAAHPSLLLVQAHAKMPLGCLLKQDWFSGNICSHVAFQIAILHRVVHIQKFGLGWIGEEGYKGSVMGVWRVKEIFSMMIYFWHEFSTAFLIQ